MPPSKSPSHKTHNPVTHRRNHRSANATVVDGAALHPMRALPHRHAFLNDLQQESPTKCRVTPPTTLVCTNQHFLQDLWQTVRANCGGRPGRLCSTLPPSAKNVSKQHYHVRSSTCTPLAWMRATALIRAAHRQASTALAWADSAVTPLAVPVTSPLLLRPRPVDARSKTRLY